MLVDIATSSSAIVSSQSLVAAIASSSASSSAASSASSPNLVAATSSWLGSLTQSVDYYYSRYWFENGEPAFRKSALIGGGPWQMLTITLTYLTAVTLFGPYMMRNRKPMQNLLWPMRLYNGFMVLFNAYLYLGFSRQLNFGLDCWGCGKAMQRVNQKSFTLWELTLLSRYFDFFDSLFFVCRKKFDHLSLLHVSHHTIVPVIVWFAGKFQPTPMTVFAGYINLPIHVIMYTYYGLSTFPSLRKYLWWKKYITRIQIAQFCLDLVHSLQIFYLPYCKYHLLTYVQTFFSLTFLYLFGQFYLQSYINRRKKTAAFSDKSATTQQQTQEIISNGKTSHINELNCCNGHEGGHKEETDEAKPITCETKKIK